MNTNTFDYETFLGGNLDNVDTFSNNTTSPVTTFSETDTDSGVGCTPPMNLDIDDTVIDLDNFDLFPLDLGNSLSDDPDNDFSRFLDELNNENPTVSVDSSTYGNLFSVPSVPQNQEAPQQLSPSPPIVPSPQPNVPSMTNCIRIQSFIPSIAGGPKIIKYEPKKLNPSITIIKTSTPMTVSTAPIITVPITTNDAVLKPVNSNTPPAIKRRRSVSPSEQQQIYELPKATIEQLKLQHGNMSDEALKKYIRMIKNRESASLSRKRRKELMENLDVTNKQLKDENDQLKMENSKLLTRIHTLEMENKLLKEYANRDPTPPARRPLILMGIVLLVVFAPFAINSFGRPSNNLLNSMETYNNNNNEAAIIPSRTILSDSRSIDQKSYPTNSDYDYGPSDNTNPMAYPYIQCVAFINKTHSQRINQDLRSWVQDQSDKQLNNQPAIIPDPKSLVIQSNSVVQTNKDSVIESLHHTTRKVARQTKIQTENKGQLQPYKTYEANYDDFIHSLDRKNDTLYFVSFKRDHLILPATIQNQTQRPKMSLILPASMANLNKSIHVPTNHVPMIKIDCEVDDTKLVFVKRSHIPSSYRNDLFQYYSSVPQATI